MTRDDLLRLLVARVRAATPPDRPCLVAVDGADGAGKTRLAADLAAALRPQVRSQVAHVSVDGFHRPRADRYARGRRSAAGFWLDSYDHDALHRDLLAPWRTGAGSYRVAVHDVVADEPVEAPARPVPRPGVLVVDGLFLLRDELRDAWDLAVRLEVPAVERFRRMAVRDGTPVDPAHPDNRRYRLGQRLYERAADPAGRADVVVDLTCWRHPVMLRG